MRRLPRFVPFAALLLAAATASAQEGKALLTLYVETTKMAIPGLEGIEIPPEALKALEQFQSGTRTLRVDLTAPGAPPPMPQANLDIPETLKLGRSLPLEVPKPGKPGAPAEGNPFGGDGKFEMRRYWSCGATVKPGQPRVLNSESLTPEQQRRFRPQVGQAGGAPATTSAFWPNSLDRAQKPIDAKAVLPGKYLLRSNFVNQVGFEIPSGIQFMGPLNVSTSTQDLTKAVTLSWKPVEGAVAYFAAAYGNMGKGAMVMWNSADSDAGSEAGYAPTAEIRAQVEKGVLLPPSKTECTIPAGIFQGAQGVSVMVHAYGPGHYQPAPQDGAPNVRVVTRSLGMASLGVKVPTR
jgi:hypothetical protein